MLATKISALNLKQVQFWFRHSFNALFTGANWQERYLTSNPIKSDQMKFRRTTWTHPLSSNEIIACSSALLFVDCSAQLLWGLHETYTCCISGKGKYWRKQPMKWHYFSKPNKSRLLQITGASSLHLILDCDYIEIYPRYLSIRSCVMGRFILIDRLQIIVNLPAEK